MYQILEGHLIGVQSQINLNLHKLNQHTGAKRAPQALFFGISPIFPVVVLPY
jgi:hypothetical protein